ncbi:glutathione S-transferase family protein [Algihabitans albus]|uniref:glutathione S-transferase family protein n=1 Tax=Algihabitans albus TaxID=2164067 RepID=UPI000E5D30CB|nr:glutathione S-transferase N-terminal domain-containing protein [Algihabitans albus]
MGDLVFHFHPSPNPMKVALLLEEIGLDYDVVPVDTFRGAQHDPAFRSLNPNAKVPVIVDDETIVFDSNAILLHLADKHGQFIPKADRGRAATLSWLFFVATGLSPFSGQAVHFWRMAPEDLPYAKNRYRKEVIRHYEVMERRLNEVPFLGGDDYSIADMAAWGWMSYAAYALAEGLSDFPKVSALFETISARPAATRAMALKARDFGLKQEFDADTARILFPQNA